MRHPANGTILEEILSPGKQLASANFRAGRRAGFFTGSRNGPRVSSLIPVIASLHPSLYAVPRARARAYSRNSFVFPRERYGTSRE